MCGKYILAQAAKAERAMGIRRGRWEYPLSYRVLPTEQVPVVVDQSGDPEAAMMRWGLIPWWAYGVPLRASTINATVERIASAPSYRDPWQHGRSEEHTSELQSQSNLVCRLLLEKKKGASDAADPTL